MTSQEVFDKVVTHLRIQNRKSMDSTVCKYRGPNGTMCAVGCMIPDSVYEPQMEFKTIGMLSMMTEYHDSLGHLLKHESLMTDLQVAHDSHFVEDWESLFVSIAQRYDLTFSPRVMT